MEDYLKYYPQRAKGVEPDKIPWSNPNYIFEVKYDGDRRLLYILDSGNTNTSRSKAADTGIPVEKKDQVPHIRDLHIPELHGTILDCEFTHPRGFQDGVRKIMGCLPEKAVERQNEWGNIEVRLFDIIALKGKLLVDEPLNVRKEILAATYEAYLSHIPFINLVEKCEGTPEELQSKLDEIIRQGGEGMVAKDINSKYRLSIKKCETPLKNAWIKVKKEFNGDFVIMGFDEPTKYFTGKDALYFDDAGHAVTEYYYKGWIGSIRFGEYENGILVERGSVSGMDKKTRAEISANPESYIGKVMELDAMERTKDKALRQPVFKRFRDDKKPEDCQYENQKG